MENTTEQLRLEINHGNPAKTVAIIALVVSLIMGLTCGLNVGIVVGMIGMVYTAVAFTIQSICDLL